MWLEAAWAAESVLFVLSERGGVYEEVARAMRAELGRSDVVETTAETPLPEIQPSVVAAIGARACESAAQARMRAPLSCVLLPRSAFESATRQAVGNGRIVTAILLDQPLARQLALIQLTVPEAREIGVLFGRESATLESGLTRAARERKLRLATARVSTPDELYSALRGVLGSADVLLAVPDSSIFNSGTAQNVLRTAFHARVPMVAFSPAYVKAGALAAVYTTPTQVGRQAGRALKDFLDGRPLPAAQAPREFEVSINAHVARALGLKLDDEIGIADKLRRLEPGG